MEIQKHLTIREAKNEIKRAENELDLYLTKKRINFQKTQPKGSKYDSVVVSGSIASFDKFTHYVIRDEDYDTKIYALIDTINAYEKYINNELIRLSNYDEEKYKVIILREEQNMEWDKISELTSYSKRQCIRIYKEFMNI